MGIRDLFFVKYFIRNYFRFLPKIAAQEGAQESGSFCRRLEDLLDSMNGIEREIRNWRWMCQELPGFENINTFAYITALESGLLDSDGRKVLVMKEGKIEHTLSGDEYLSMSEELRKEWSRDGLVVQVPPLHLPIETIPYNPDERHDWRALAVDIACSEAGTALEAAANPQPTTATRRPLRHQVG